MGSSFVGPYLVTGSEEDYYIARSSSKTCNDTPWHLYYGIYLFSSFCDDRFFKIYQYVDFLFIHKSNINFCFLPFSFVHYLQKLSELVKKGVDSLPLSPAIRPFILQLLNQFLGKEDVFRARSVSDLLWGYDDFILLTFYNFTVELNKQLKNHSLPFHVPIINFEVMLQVSFLCL